jgi:hypothetical protein
MGRKGSGVVQYPGYKTGGQIKKNGMKNKRSAIKARKKREDQRRKAELSMNRRNQEEEDYGY